MLPQIVTRTAGSIASRMGHIGTDVITRCLAAITLTNFKHLEARFKFLLNVNLNNFIIEHTTETKIFLLVPLDHRNIFQARWANLKSPDLAIKYLPIIKMMFDVTCTSIINNFDNVEVPTACHFQV
jgi:hypothetical protein